MPFGNPDFLATVWKRYRRRRWRARVPYEGIVYAIILVVLLGGALLGRSNLLLLVFALMAGPWIVNGALCFNILRNVDLKRQAPSRAMAGEPFSVELTIHNAKRLLSSWLLIVTDRLEHTQEKLAPQVLLTRIPANSERSAHYQACLAQRGIYRFGPVRVSTQFPLGLAERSLVIQEAGEILVYPRLGELSSQWRRQTKTAYELVQQTRSRRGSFSDEFHSLREYRAGDDPRTIHWRTSARHNELMVREFQQSRDDDLTVLLDPWCPARPDGEDLSRVELAISFAATIGYEHCAEARGCSLELSILVPEMERWREISGPSAVDPYLKRLALAQTSSATDLAKLVGQAMSQQPSHGRIVLITTRPMHAGGSREDEDGDGDGDGDHRPRHAMTAEQTAASRQLLELSRDSFAGGRHQPPLEIIEADMRQLAGLFQLDARPR